MTRRPVSAIWIVLVCALWMATVGNLPLWRKLASLGLFQTLSGAMFGAAMASAIFGVLVMLLGLLAWRATLKIAMMGLLLITTLCSHFMLTYGVVMDPGMITNTVQTNVREAAALANWQLGASVVIFALLPAVVLWRQPMDYGRWGRQSVRSVSLVVVGILISVTAVFASFQTLASVMRNHKDVRYLINPLAAIYSAGRVAARPFERHDTVLARIGEDAKLSPRPSNHLRPPLLLLVLGETGRAGNFSINGYARPTTPGVEREGAVTFRNAWACGTSTAASLPCMFSNLGREKFEDRTTNQEGLLDVLQRAGLAVLWIDNQSGCKGVCERVPSVSTASNTSSPLCSNGECLDGIMLQGLDERIASLEPERLARGLVIVMHQMGSHGPAYYLRSPTALKRFQPECTSTALYDCSKDALVNAYDNSVAYTDHFLSEAIVWLKKKSVNSDTAMIYVADHGESLGENNIYLHGMPYAVAPDVQKHIPWITWVSEGFKNASGLSLSCLRLLQDQRISHDHYFHSVLGFLNVASTTYQAALDAYAPCRENTGATAPTSSAR